MERAEVLIEYSGGKMKLRRRNPIDERWVDDEAPTRVRAASTGSGALVIEVHRSELDDVARFAFAVASWEEDDDGDFVAADIAPNELLWTYKLSHSPPLHLVGDSVFGTPSRPVAGKPFRINLPVRRSDTSRPITRGTVECMAIARRRKLRATAALADGIATCSLRVPRSATGIRGSMTVHSAGKSVTARFSGAVDFGGGVGK